MLKNIVRLMITSSFVIALTWGTSARAQVPSSQTSLDSQAIQRGVRDEPDDSTHLFFQYAMAVGLSEESFGFAGPGASFTGWANALAGGLDFGRFGLTLSVPFAYGRTAFGSLSRDEFAFGNLALGGFFDVLPNEDDVAFRVLARVSLPTTPDNSIGQLGGYMVDYLNFAAYAPDLVTPVLGAEFRAQNDFLVFNASALLSFFIFYNSTTHVGLTGNLSLAGRLGRTLDIGAALRGIVNVDQIGDPVDAAQTAAEIFLVTDPSLNLPVFIRGGFMFYLDNSFGPSFQDGRPWAVQLSVGSDIVL